MTKTMTKTRTAPSQAKAAKPKRNPKRNPSPSDREQLGSLPPSQPALRFAPTAWAKLLYFRDRGHTEVGGFAITNAEDLLYVEAFATVEQEVSVASVAFDDAAVADWFEAQVDANRRPEQFAKHLRRMPLDADIQLNLLSNELTVAPS